MLNFANTLLSSYAQEVSMRIKSPPLGHGLAELFANPERLAAVLQQVTSPTRQDGRYIHYHKLSFLQPPEGLTTAEWWAGLKLKRSMLRRQLPLLDRDGRPHLLCRTDSMDELLHKMDRQLTGNGELPQEVLNADTRDSHLFSSLIEEAVLSSQMEGATTSRRVAADMLRAGRDPRNHSERMIFNNFRAMQRILKVAEQPLTPELVCQIHRIVTDGTMLDPAHAGMLRQTEDGPFGVWDHVQLVFEAPPSDQLPARMEAMCEFANQEKPGGVFIHPILKAIVLHYWLAHDHPFEDGNGRTARSLFYWAMLHQGYSLCQFVSISAVIAKAKKDYEKAFLYVQSDENDLTYFALQQLSVLQKAIDQMHRHVKKKAVDLERTRSRMRQAEGLNHRQLALLDRALADRHARFTVQSHGTSHRVSAVTARNDLNALVERGCLQTRKQGKRIIYLPAADLQDRFAPLP